MKHLLIIEDDPEIQQLLTYHLKDEGYKIDSANRGDLGYEKAKGNNYDLILLDVSLPGKNGFDICRDLRLEENPTPIIMLTARTEEVDRILGLEFGADDYVTKPFSVRELMARIKAIFRRVGQQVPGEKALSQSTIDRDPLIINTEKRQVSLSGNPVKLTPIEYNLLVLLASNPGKTFSKDALLNQVWGYEYNGFRHTVSSHVNRLRNKVENDPENPQFILTTWGVGYRFNDEL